MYLINSRRSLPLNMPKFKNKKTPITACQQSQSAIIDLIILSAVIVACGFLIHPYITLLLSETLEILTPIMIMIEQELTSAPIIYMCLGLTIFASSIAVLAMTLWTSPKCGKHGCRGLDTGPAFEIRIEKVQCLKNWNSNSDLNLNSNSSFVKKTGLFELQRDYHRELEAKLKKMAPANGRVVLVFRARCGCSVGRMEIPGPKRINRKIKR